MQSELRQRSEKHDYTKIQNIEEFYNNFKAVQDNPEIDFTNMNWFKLHVTSERHHLNDSCPDDVNLFDVMERIADITVAGMARTGKIYDDSLCPGILFRAYKNTVTFIKDKINVNKE